MMTERTQTAIELASKIYTFQRKLIKKNKWLLRQNLTENTRFWTERSLQHLEETLERNTGLPLNMGPIQLKRASKKTIQIDSWGNLEFVTEHQ